MKKTLLVLLFVLLSASLVFGAGTKEQAAETGETTVRWAYWGSGERVTISQEAIDLYESRNPGVKVNPEVSGGAGDHFVKVDTQLAGGNGPDIIQMGGNIYDYADVLLPLDQYAGTLLDTAVIDPSAVASGTIDGKLLGVSTGVTMPALVYNKSMIERAGVPLPKRSLTYDEFRDYLVLLKSKLPRGVYPMQDIGVMSTNSTPFGYWTRYNGTPLYTAATSSTDVTASDAQKYLELFADYRKNGLVPPPDVAAGFAENNADSSALIAGKVAIGYLYTNQLGGYQAATTDELELMEFPGAAATKALWQAPSQFYTVNKDSKNPEETVKFINFLVNDPDAALILGSNRGASASASARAAGAASPADQKVLDYMQVAGPHSSAETDHVPNDTEFNSTLFLIYQRVAFGEITPAEGGKQIRDLLVRLINK
ncbi:extracellular solute-binding protein [uncultured Sphaerochaeta sp.]|uniref:ABC transporter substrate-binding protein n=1 Tax=uncultured Sphaerochaeta sp. TaxID=886478 RepID=UPI002A0A22DD|nr:extracellular solute-binding protein [uncultured Sphaerochaeta sp.]